MTYIDYVYEVWTYPARGVQGNRVVTFARKYQAEDFVKHYDGAWHAASDRWFAIKRIRVGVKVEEKDWYY